MDVLIENGGMCPASALSTAGELNVSSAGAILQLDENTLVPDGTKAIFYAQAGSAVRCLSLEC